MTEENKSVKNFPNLRFPGFEGGWKVKKLGDVSNISSGGTPNRNNHSYWNGNIPWVTTSLIDFNLIETTDEYITNEGLKNSSAKLFPKETLLMAMYGQGKTRGKIGMLNIEASTNQACGAIIIDKSILNPFFAFQNLAKRYDEIRDLSNQGGQENLSGGIIKGIEIIFPNLLEQEKISSFFTFIDKRIQTQKKIIEGLKTLKIQSRNKLFTQIIKGGYERFTVEEILNYEQPTKYIVSSTDYSSDNSLIPVLTANKAFLLGYTNEDWGIYDKGKCIILDDFTMDLKYVDFPFKIKSSAIKLLTSKKNIDLKFVFEYFSFLNMSSNEHKRHYISEIQPMFLNVPSEKIQKNISNFLSKLDEKINLENELLTQYENQKKYLLQNLFV